MLRLLAGLTVLATLALPAQAQCTTVPNSGCGIQTAPVCGTPPQIGTSFVWRCAPTCLTTNFTPFIIIGTPLMGTVPILPPLACNNTACLLACQPLVVLQAPGATLQIPNNPTLVGLVLCIQCACVDLSAPCLELTQAARVAIMP